MNVIAYKLAVQCKTMQRLLCTPHHVALDCYALLTMSHKPTITKLFEVFGACFELVFLTTSH